MTETTYILLQNYRDELPNLKNRTQAPSTVSSSWGTAPPKPKQMTRWSVSRSPLEFCRQDALFRQFNLLN